jgi:drug/metabolite transporter (DMT)-like permease
MTRTRIVVGASLLVLVVAVNAALFHFLSREQRFIALMIGAALVIVGDALAGRHRRR